MKALLVFAGLAAACVPILAQNGGDPPFLFDADWQPLLSGAGLTGWHPQSGKQNEWLATRGVLWDKQAAPVRLTPASRPGDRILNGQNGKTVNLVSDRAFGDIELYLEFLIPKGSNSGVYLHGLYEVQILDSYGVAKPGVHDCGAIYERWIDNKGSGGSPPFRNASRPAGEWQSFQIWFRAPRFDARRRKVESAKFLRVVHNGIEVQQNVLVEGPTRAGMEIPEAAENPLMLQGDHGPVAFRNMYFKSLRPPLR
jgi:hypothetical protein